MPFVIFFKRGWPLLFLMSSRHAVDMLLLLVDHAKDDEDRAEALIELLFNLVPFVNFKA